MREILALCIELDGRAERLYRTCAERLVSDDLRALFRSLADEERMHVVWWRELLDAWDRGLLPDIVDDPQSLLERLRRVDEEIDVTQPTSSAPLDPQAALELAAQVEFFMLDPVFGELIDLMEPAHAATRHDAYSHHIQRLVSAIARHAQPGSTTATLAKVLERTWSDNRELTRFATQDPLTRLRNRRALDTHLPQWLAWAARYGRPIAVVLVDLDGLKVINDSHGHRAGDRALRTVAESIRSSIRASDLALRYGGDEFAIVAPESAIPEYDALARRLLAAVRSRPVTVEGGEIPVRVTIGGAVALDPAGSPPRSVDELIAAADTSLYAAKRAGRDRAGAAVMLELR